MAQMKFDPIKPLHDLTAVIGQIEASKDVDRDARVQAKMWEGMADKLDEALTGDSADQARKDKAAMYKRAAEGVTGLAVAAKACRDIAAHLNPVAEVNWTTETLEDMLVSVRFFLIAGAYEGDQMAEAQDAIAKAAVVTKTKTSTGVRGEGRIIPDRPEKIEVVSVIGDEPVLITAQAGNKESAPGNIKKSVVAWLEKNNVQVTDDINSALADAIGQCVRDGKDEVAIGDFAVIRHAA